MTNSAEKAEDVKLLQQLHAETAKIKWHELQRFFAQGLVLRVADDYDLLTVAKAIANDDSEKIKSLLANGLVAAPSNDQARAWYKANAGVWSVVVAPFVLVQSCNK